MALTKKEKDTELALKLEQLVIRLSKDNNMSREEALRYILKSETYRVLCLTRNGLYLESFPYVYDKLKAEIVGNYAKWEQL